MPKYRIYAGLGGGFDGANYQYTEEFVDEDDANVAAYQEACQIYDSQSGCGIEGWDDFMEEAKQNISEENFEDEQGYESALEDYANQVENEARENWIDYYVVLVGSEEDIEIDEPED